MRIARMAGVRIFATGGIGGVHRNAAVSHDVSSDIDELSATPVAVLCSGAKSILDLPATLEMLESRRVPVVGLGVDELPAFYAASSGLPLTHRADSIGAAARMALAHLSLPGAGGMLLVQPPPSELALDAAEVEGWIAAAVAAAAQRGVRGGSVTPFVLSHIAAASGGRTLATNIGLIVNNARVAGELAVEMALVGD